MRKKALFLDLDGTLLTDQKTITPGNQEAVNKALRAGHQIIVTSGRPLVSSITQAQALGLAGPGCYLIAYNGCVLYDFSKESVIYRSSLPLETIRTVFEEAARRDIHIQTYDERYVLVEPRCDTDTTKEYCRRILMEYRVIPSIASLSREPEKMLVIDFHNKKKLDDFRDWLSASAFTGVDTFYSNNAFLEVVPAGMSKGSALCRMASLLGIPMEDTIAAGDAPNDISMIEAAHTGVAMKNAEEEVKAVAQYITRSDNNHDGIAEVINELMLEQ